MTMFERLRDYLSIGENHLFPMTIIYEAYQDGPALDVVGASGKQ
jgi:hypothetical protein